MLLISTKTGPSNKPKTLLIEKPVKQFTIIDEWTQLNLYDWKKPDFIDYNNEIVSKSLVTTNMFSSFNILDRPYGRHLFQNLSTAI